jgi:cytochrome c oxidase subunit I+III
MSDVMNERDLTRVRARFDEVWSNPRGWAALTIVNHTTVGLRFMTTGGVFFLIGGLLAMMMRSQLASPGQNLLEPETYNQVFTMHGTIMMFLFAVPILEGLALYLIPKMIGARDLVFPRLSAFGYFCYLFGGIILVSSLVFGIAPNSGWFMYTPLSSDTYSPGPNADFWLLGITFVEISAVSAAVELVVSILRTRTANMALQHMPLFCWYILVTSFMIIFGFPPLILASILLEVERSAGLPFFDAGSGGDPILWQHLFWLFGHPEVYIIFLPAAGIVSTILPVFSQRPIVGYRWFVLAVIATGFISFGLWVHHMFTVGIPHLAQAFFSVASMLVAIPTGIQIFGWLATLWTGKPVFSIPMLWVLGFLFIFVLGGLTGVMVALVPFDWQVHDTHFVVAHMHYVLVGGMLFPLIAGLYFWLPHLSARLPSGLLAHWGFWLTFIGFNLTFLIMHWTGLLGMTRRIYTYDSGLGWDMPNLISSVGAFMMAMGILATLLDLVLHFRYSRKATSNPWNADTLDWATSTPPANYNFLSLPECATRHPLWDKPDLPLTIAQGQHYLASAKHGRRETLGSDPLTGEVRETIHLPGNSWLPFISAVVLAIVCISLLVKVYWFAAVATVVSLVFLLRWSWENGAHPAAEPDPTTEPGMPPLHSRTADGPGIWGMAVSLLANGTLYLSMLFGWLYLWSVAPQWQVPAEAPLTPMHFLASGLLITIAALWFWFLRRRTRGGDCRGLQGQLWGAAVVGLIHCVTLVWGWNQATLAPRQTAHDAVITIMLVYIVVHTGMAVVITALQALRVRFGYVGEHAPYELTVVLQWWLYSLVVFWLGIAALLGVPTVWGASL